MANGLTSMKSQFSFSETYNKLKEVIENNPNLKIVAELDHQANAKKVDLELNPTKIIFFGNPEMGSPLMIENQEIAIDLPQKMIVYETANNEVIVAYNSPEYLKKRHNIVGNNEIIEKMANALLNIVKAATE